MWELQNLQENHVYKYLKYKFSMQMVKKLHKVNQQEQPHNGLQGNQQVEL